MVSDEVCVYTIPDSFFNPKDFTILVSGSNIEAKLAKGSSYSSMSLLSGFEMNEEYSGNNEFDNYYIIIVSNDSGPSYNITVSYDSSGVSFGTGAIVGVVISGVIFISCMVCICCFCKKFMDCCRGLCN